MERQRHAVAEPAPSYGRRALITKQVDVGRVEDLLSPRPTAAPTPKPPADPFDQQPWPKGLGRTSSITSSKMAAFNPPEPSEPSSSEPNRVLHGRRAILTGTNMAAFNPGRDPLHRLEREASAAKASAMPRAAPRGVHLHFNHRLDATQARPIGREGWRAMPKDALDTLVLQHEAGVQRLGPAAFAKLAMAHGIGRRSRWDRGTMLPVVPMAAPASAANPNALDSWIARKLARGYCKAGSRKGSDLTLTKAHPFEVAAQERAKATAE